MCADDACVSFEEQGLVLASLRLTVFPSSPEKTTAFPRPHPPTHPGSCLTNTRTIWSVEERYVAVGFPTMYDAFPTANVTLSHVWPSSKDLETAISCTAPSEQEPCLASANATRVPACASCQWKAHRKVQAFHVVGNAVCSRRTFKGAVGSGNNYAPLSSPARGSDSRRLQHRSVGIPEPLSLQPVTPGPQRWRRQE